MLQPDLYAEERWRAIFHELDRLLVSAVRSYVERHFLGASDLAIGFSELAALRAGADPDYSMPGVAAAYAFAYLPRRVASILGVLSLLAKHEIPRRVLDIGSGPGATAIALGLLEPDSHIRVDAIEPSHEMRRFAAEFPFDSTVSLRPLPGRLEDIGTAQMPLRACEYDLIVMSACLPYGDSDLGTFTRWLASAPRPPAALLAIEPAAKEAQLRRLARALGETGSYGVHSHCCHEMPGIVRRYLILEECTQLLHDYYQHLEVNPHLSLRGRQLLGRPPYSVMTWSEHREMRDAIVVCTHLQEGPPVAEDGYTQVASAPRHRDLWAAIALVQERLSRWQRAKNLGG